MVGRAWAIHCSRLVVRPAWPLASSCQRKSGLPRGVGHRGDHEARVGEQLRRLRHAGEVDARDLPGDGRVPEAGRQAAQLRVVARHLVDRVEVRHQRHAGLGRQHVRLQLHLERLRVVAGDRAGGDRVLGPRDHGRGDEQRLPGEVALHDGHGFRDALDALDEHVVGAGVGLPEVVERPVQRRVVAVLEELLHQGGDLAFPEAVLGEAAGGMQSVGQGDESFGVPGEAGRGLASGAGHGGGAGRGNAGWDDDSSEAYFIIAESNDRKTPDARIPERPGRRIARLLLRPADRLLPRRLLPRRGGRRGHARGVRARDARSSSPSASPAATTSSRRSPRRASGA